MKLSVPEAFERLRNNLKLDPGELAKVIATHNTVTAHLKALGLITGGFLQGSLARKTMVAPLRDVDKVVLLAVDYRNLPGGARLAADQIAAALRQLYPLLEPAVGKHCVTLDFGETTFSFDIVPAIDLGDDIEIVDAKLDRWMVSNTRELIRIVQERNGECAGNFIHQARMGKAFARQNAEGLVPGLHVESFAFQAITVSMPDDEALAALLCTGQNALSSGTQYFEPTGRDELGHRIDPPARQRARSAFAEGARLSSEAVALRRSDDHNSAIAIWHKLLGDVFPKPDATTALTALGVGAGVSAAGVITPAAQIRTTPTRSWRP
jgi:hypothetical protein